MNTIVNPHVPIKGHFARKFFRTIGTFISVCIMPVHMHFKTILAGKSFDAPITTELFAI
jgi:hypothetical protein